MSRAPLSIRLLECWAAVLPSRIAEEDLGGFIELLHRRGARGRQAWALVASGVFWTACNTLREWPYHLTPRVLRRIVMWIAALNFLFAASLGSEPLEALGRNPEPLMAAQCLFGLVLSALWVGSGVAAWRRWSHRRQLTVGTAAATLLFTVMMSNLMGYFGLVVYTVYPLAVLVVFAWSPRPSDC